MLVLLPIAFWGLRYSSIFLFGSLATNVQILMMWWNVTCWMKSAHTMTNEIQTRCQDWTVWFGEERFDPNPKTQYHILCIVEFEVSNLVILLLVDVSAFVELYLMHGSHFLSHVSPLSHLFPCHVALPSWQFWSYEVVHGVRDDQSDLGLSPLCRSFPVEPWRAAIFDDRRHFGSYGECKESRTLPENV